MPEFCSHIFAMNWNLCYDTAATGAILLFYIFLSIGFSSITIGLRKAGLPLIRSPSGSGDVISFLADWVLIILSISTPVIYYTKGKATTQVFFVIIQSTSAIIWIPRIWKNLGPSKEKLIIGAISELIAVIITLPTNSYMVMTGE